MATTITAGGTSGIAMANLKHIVVYKTSLKVVFQYGDGSTTTVTGSDATDFITNGLPFLAGQAQVDVFPLL
jgi:hypothetical protein